MKFKKIALFTLCFINCFITKSFDNSNKLAKLDPKVVLANLDKSNDLCKNLTGKNLTDIGITPEKLIQYENPNDLHKRITDLIRLARPESPKMNPGEASTICNRYQKIDYYKPTLDERAIILRVLQSRKNIFKKPEEIADLIHIYKSDDLSAGFYISKTDKIYVSKGKLSNPSSLLHTISHEIQHYTYDFGHRICANAVDLDPQVYTFIEELRADNNAVKIVNCAKCAKKIMFKRIQHNLSQDDCSLVEINPSLELSESSKEKLCKWGVMTGYVSNFFYTDPKELAKMKPYCQLCSPELVQQDYQKEILALFHP